jgi:hypothetical protein
MPRLGGQGQEMIIVSLDRVFGSQSRQDQEDAITEVQLHAQAAGLAGTVVPV